MPATTPNPTKSAANGNGSAPAYVKCDLTAEQKLLCKTWADELEWVDMVAWVDKLVADAHVISIKPMEGGGFQCAVTGQGSVTVGTHNGKCLIGRASSPVKSLLVAMYKDAMILQGSWTVMERTVDLDL